MGYQEEKQRQLDLRYLRMASIWAENSYCVRRKVGALIVKDKMIISDGYNGTSMYVPTRLMNLMLTLLLAPLMTHPPLTYWLN